MFAASSIDVQWYRVAQKEVHIICAHIFRSFGTKLTFWDNVSAFTALGQYLLAFPSFRIFLAFPPLGEFLPSPFITFSSKHFQAIIVHFGTTVILLKKSSTTYSSHSV